MTTTTNSGNTEDEILETDDDHGNYSLEGCNQQKMYQIQQVIDYIKQKLIKNRIDPIWMKGPLTVYRFLILKAHLYPCQPPRKLELSHFDSHNSLSIGMDIGERSVEVRDEIKLVRSKTKVLKISSVASNISQVR